MTHRVPRRPTLAALALLAALGAPASAEPPPEGRCPDVGGGAAGLRGDGGDALLHEGDVLLFLQKLAVPWRSCSRTRSGDS